MDDLRRLRTGWRWTRRSLPPEGAPDVPPTSERFAFETGWARALLSRAVREAALGGALGPLLRASALDVSVAGLEYLERSQPPVVFVANHVSHLDGLLVLHALPRAWRKKTVVAAASDYFFDAWWRSMVSALALNAVPVERHTGSGSQSELTRLLAWGWNVLAFPEGTRSRDGTLARFRHGPARLALDARRPVVPVAIRGTFGAMPVGQRWPRPGQVRVRFGPPLAPRPGERLGEVTARVRVALERLLVEDATTWWSALRGVDHPPQAARWRRVWANSAPLPPQTRPHVWGRGGKA
jgi:1-acyl-sn-glycerol-3-phosphate acyltransferase